MDFQSKYTCKDKELFQNGNMPPHFSKAAGNSGFPFLTATSGNRPFEEGTKYKSCYYENETVLQLLCQFNTRLRNTSHRNKKIAGQLRLNTKAKSTPDKY